MPVLLHWLVEHILELCCSAPHSLLAMGKVDSLHPDLVADPLGILRPHSKLTHQLPLVKYLSTMASSKYCVPFVERIFGLVEMWWFFWLMHNRGMNSISGVRCSLFWGLTFVVAFFGFCWL